MPRYVKIILAGLAALLLSLILCVIVISTVSWEYAKPWINQQASTLANRPVAVNGRLTLRWVKPSNQEGWRSWIPWPEISADNIMLGNPWKDAENMANIKSLKVVFNPWALPGHTVQIQNLEVRDGNISLEKREDKSNNWTFGKQQDTQASTWDFKIQHLILNNVQLRFADQTRQLDLTATFNSLRQASPSAASNPEPYEVDWVVKGTYQDKAVQGKGRMGTLLSLRADAAPLRMDGDVQIDSTSIGATGTLPKLDLSGPLDIQLRLSGDSMHELYSILGVVLPTTAPYHTEGRLVRTPGADGDTWLYENFKGTVGKSDLAGTLRYQVRKPRPLLTGQLESKLLRLRDLGPLIGIDTSTVKGKTARQAAQAQPKNKALPVKHIDTARWGAMDADVKFTGRKIVRDKSLPLDNISAHVELNDRVLSFRPLNFGVAGGTLSNTLVLNGQEKTIKARIKTTAKHLKLKQLFPAAASMKASFGEVYGDLSLTGSGTSVATLLAHANGQVQLLVSRGTISKALLETAGLNIANIIIGKLFGDKQVVLNCLAGDFVMTDGLLQTRVFTLETDDALVELTGQINFANERLDLDVKPDNKSLRIFTLRSPLYVKGTFKNPDVGVQAGPLAARAGAAIALGLASPFAAILPLLNLGTNDSSDCGALLAQVEKPSKAPQKRPAQK